jgi:primosomal protein N' (replication factor Y)
MFVETLLPLSIPGTYTYRLPEGTTVEVGSRVLVPFGRKKIYTAIVASIHNVAPTGYEVKDIISVLDSTPILRHPQMKFWEWISSYYLCSMGEVYKAALPSSLKLESETFISPNPDFEEDPENRLSDNETVVLDFTTQRGRVQVADITNATGFKSVEGIVHRLLEKNAIHVSERVIDNYRPKTISCVRLTIGHTDKEKLHAFFDQVKRARKQEQLLLAYLDMSHWLSPNGEPAEVIKDELLKRADVTQPVLSAAVQRGIFEVYKREINRFAHLGTQLQEPPVLTDEQKRAYSELHQSFKQHDVTLLHGVTSSGKTSIYMHLIADTLKLRFEHRIAEDLTQHAADTGFSLAAVPDQKQH